MGRPVYGPRPHSPLESLAWVLWHEAGMPAPALQATIRHAGRFIGRVDFLWCEARVVAEADGLGKYADRAELQRELRGPHRADGASTGSVKITSYFRPPKPRLPTAETRS